LLTIVTATNIYKIKISIELFFLLLYFLGITQCIWNDLQIIITFRFLLAIFLWYLLLQSIKLECWQVCERIINRFFGILSRFELRCLNIVVTNDLWEVNKLSPVERYGEPILTILEVFECVMNTLLYVELDIGLCWLFRVLVLWDKYLSIGVTTQISLANK